MAKKVNYVNKVARSVQKGFTLIEVLVVVFLLGILAVIIGPSLTGGSDGARAQAVFETTRFMSRSWNLVSQSCGSGLSLDSNSVLADVSGGGSSTQQFLTLMYEGSIAVDDSSNMRRCVERSSISGLAGTVVRTNDGRFLISGREITNVEFHSPTRTLRFSFASTGNTITDTEWDELADSYGEAASSNGSGVVYRADNQIRHRL